MAGWVYRRPAAIRRRRFVPPTFAALRVVVRRRARVRLRRPFYLRRRQLVPAVAIFAAVAPPVLRRALRRQRRQLRGLRRVGLVQSRSPTPAPGSVARVRRVRIVRRLGKVRRASLVASRAASGTTFVLRLRRVKPRRTASRRRPARAPGSTPAAPGKTGPVVRIHKAIARMRRSMQARLRWRRLEEEIPPDSGTPVVGEETVLKGRIAQPGLVRGRIVTGGM